MSYRLSVSVSKGETGKACTPEHDLRTNPHWTPTRRSFKEYRKYNVIDAIPIRGHAATYREAYDTLFASTVAEYNARQKKPSRRISSLYDKMMADKKSDPYVTFVFQFGDAKTNPITGLDSNDPQALAARDATIEAMRNAARKLETTGHFAVLGGQLHCDEWHLDSETGEWQPGTIHGHLSVVPLADGYKSGLSVRPSFGKALKQVYGSDQKGFVELHDMLMETMEDAGRAHGIERQVMGNDERHVDIASYAARKEAQKREQSVAEREAKVDERESSIEEKELDIDARLKRSKATEDDANKRAERARKDAEKARQDQKAAEEAAEAARQGSEAALKAQRDAEAERDKAEKAYAVAHHRAQRLGPEGDGIDWNYPDGSRRHEQSIREARKERDKAIQDRDAARKDLEAATAERDKAQKDLESAKASLADTKKSLRKATSDLKGTREDLRALNDGDGIDWPNDDGSYWHEKSLREVREERNEAQDEAEDAQQERDRLYEDIDQAREDYKVASDRKPFGLREVIASVVDVAADFLDDAGFGRAADFLRSVSDRIIEKATDRLAPETVRAHAMRKLADAPDEWKDEPDSGLDGPQ